MLRVNHVKGSHNRFRMKAVAVLLISFVSCCQLLSVDNTEERPLGSFTAENQRHTPDLFDGDFLLPGAPPRDPDLDGSESLRYRHPFGSTKKGESSDPRSLPAAREYRDYLHCEKKFIPEMEYAMACRCRQRMNKHVIYVEREWIGDTNTANSLGVQVGTWRDRFFAFRELNDKKKRSVAMRKRTRGPEKANLDDTATTPNCGDDNKSSSHQHDSSSSSYTYYTTTEDGGDDSEMADKAAVTTNSGAVEANDSSSYPLKEYHHRKQSDLNKNISDDNDDDDDDDNDEEDWNHKKNAKKQRADNDIGDGDNHNNGGADACDYYHSSYGRGGGGGKDSYDDDEEEEEEDDYKRASDRNQRQRRQRRNLYREFVFQAPLSSSDDGENRREVAADDDERADAAAAAAGGGGGTDHDYSEKVVSTAVFEEEEEEKLGYEREGGEGGGRNAKNSSFPSSSPISYFSSRGGSKVSAGALITCWYLSLHSQLVANKSLLDIGTGTGIVGILAATSLRAKSVTLNDVDTQLLDVLRTNVGLNTNKSHQLRRNRSISERRHNSSSSSSSSSCCGSSGSSGSELIKRRGNITSPATNEMLISTDNHFALGNKESDSFRGGKDYRGKQQYDIVVASELTISNADMASSVRTILSTLVKPGGVLLFVIGKYDGLNQALRTLKSEAVIFNLLDISLLTACSSKLQHRCRAENVLVGVRKHDEATSNNSQHQYPTQVLPDALRPRSDQVTNPPRNIPDFIQRLWRIAYKQGPNGAKSPSLRSQQRANGKAGIKGNNALLSEKDRLIEAVREALSTTAM